jgi:hypothetical protein
VSRFLVPIAALVLATGLGCDPFFTFSGGALSGEVKPVPADWAFTDEVDTIQLETRPDDPYSVNVWGVAVGNDIYVAGAAGRTWAGYIAADPDVRLRVGDDIYELRAEQTEDPAELEAFLVAAKKKYDFELDPEDRYGATLYRLKAR